VPVQQMAADVATRGRRLDLLRVLLGDVAAEDLPEDGPHPPGDRRRRRTGRPRGTSFVAHGVDTSSGRRLANSGQISMIAMITPTPIENPRPPARLPNTL